MRYSYLLAPLLVTCAVLVSSAQNDSAFKTVVAEGVGLTVEDARKDAFRGAVRQAVGALIDAETLVHNDQVIKDQILAYSNAMIKSYKEVDKPKLDGGLYRITILAAVERLGLEQKVEKAKASFQKVDGEGLYAQFLKDIGVEKAQKLTDGERRTTARAMMEKLLDGYPLNCMETTIEGEPKVLKREGDKITFQVRIILKPNLKEYDAFANRLMTRLEKMARQKDEFGLKAEVKTYETSTYFQHSLGWGEVMGRLFEETGQGNKYRSKGTCVVAVNASRVKANDRTVWKYFELDDTVRHPLASAASSVLTLKVWWEDKDGKVRDTERVPAVVEIIGTPTTASLIVPGAGNGVSAGNPGFRGFSRGHYDAMVSEEGEGERAGPEQRLFLLSPYFHLQGYGMYVPQGTVAREFTLSVDDVKDLKSFKCELRFEDDNYREFPPRVAAGK